MTQTFIPLWGCAHACIETETKDPRVFVRQISARPLRKPKVFFRDATIFEGIAQQ